MVVGRKCSDCANLFLNRKNILLNLKKCGVRGSPNPIFILSFAPDSSYKNQLIHLGLWESQTLPPPPRLRTVTNYGEGRGLQNGRGGGK